MAPSSPSNGQAARKLFDVVVTESNAREVRDAVKVFLERNTDGQASRYLPTDRQLGALVSELRRVSGMNSSDQPESDECHIPEDFIPVDIHTNGEKVTTSNDSRPELRWMQTPSQESGKQAAKAMARDAFPNGTASQDGLNFFCGNAEAQKIFHGQQLNSGAALLLPKDQQQALLSTLAVKLPSTEVAKALSLIQALLPVLTGNVESQASRDIVQIWAQKNLSSGLDIPRFFESCLEIFQQPGLGSMEGAQELLALLVEESGTKGILNGMEDSLHQLSQRLSDRKASNLPHVNGLNEFLGGNLGQGLNQVLQPLVRLLSGLFLMKPEYQWPRALPNEKALADMATLFASQSEKSTGRKNKRRRKRKGFQAVFGFSESDLDRETFLESINIPDEKIHELAS